MVWGITNDSKVILENFEEDKDEQLWKKGEPNAEGYFTLENYKVSKFITASSSNSLELKGNITFKVKKKTPKGQKISTWVKI
jgi:hypothetical protein